MASPGISATTNHWTSKLTPIPTPCYLINEAELTRNLEILEKIKNQTNCTILVALKGFSTFSTFPNIRNYLDGVTASSIYEAKLGYEEFNKNIHGHAIAMEKNEAKEFSKLCATISVNSINQLQLFEKMISHQQSLGIRINPQVSTVKTAIYDPCAKHSRLGIPIDQVDSFLFNKIDGLHFHALCEQNTDSLEKVLQKIEATFGDHLSKLSWMNWGGGHLITDNEYNSNHLIKLINYWQNKYGINVILEPGEAIGLNCGYYITKVIDIINNEKEIAICDISATCHMPDVLEYPYRPNILYSGLENEYKYQYMVTGNTCLAGDIIGTYSFKEKLNIGSTLVFTDMGHYTIVKTSNFNGIKQPSIGMISKQGGIKIISKSSYHNFKERLS